MKTMKTLALTSAFFLGFLNIPAFAVASPQAKPQLINQVVAVVNQTAITQTELDEAILQIKAQASAQGLTLPDTIDLKKQALKKLIFEKAALDLADMSNVTVSNEEVDAAIQTIAERNNVSEDKLLQSLKAQGISETDYRRSLHTQLVIQKLEQQTVAGSILITPQEVEHYLAQQAKLPNPDTEYHVQHILIALPNQPTPKDIAHAQAKANKVLSEIKNGLKFSTAAVKYSDSGDALTGGDLGYKPLGELPTLFEKAVIHMKSGQIEGPFQDSNGFHLIKLVGTKTPPPQTHYLTEKKVQIITIKVTPVMSSSKAQALLEHLRTAAEHGVSFSKLAKDNSQDPDTASKGGDAGWINPSEVPPSYANALQETATGKISEPFLVGDHWQMIKVIDSRQIDNTKNYQLLQARKALFEQKAMSVLQTWRSQLVSQVYVDILVPQLAMPEFDPQNELTH